MSKHQLKHFPQLMAAFEEIMYDDPLPGERLLPEAVIPDNWLYRFKTAERILTELQDKSLDELFSTEQRKAVESFNCYDGTPPKGSAFQTVVMPINEDDDRVLRAAGYSEEESKLVRGVLCDFFDGELRKLVSTHGSYNRREI